MPTIACLVLFLLGILLVFVDSLFLGFLIVATCVWDETKEGVDAIRTTSEIEVGCGSFSSLRGPGIHDKYRFPVKGHREKSN
jgi:hypothetical protein